MNTEAFFYEIPSMGWSELHAETKSHLQQEGTFF